MPHYSHITQPAEHHRPSTPPPSYNTYDDAPLIKETSAKLGPESPLNTDAGQQDTHFPPPAYSNCDMSSTNNDLEAQLPDSGRKKQGNAPPIAAIASILSICYLGWRQDNGVELNSFERAWALVAVIGSVVTGLLAGGDLKEREEREKEERAREMEEMREEERRRWRKEFEMELVEGVRNGGGPRVVMGVVDGEKR